MNKSRFLIIINLLLLLFIPSCVQDFNLAKQEPTPSMYDLLDIEKSELEDNFQIWNDQGINNYRYTLDISCLCWFNYELPITIEVNDGEVASVWDGTGKLVSINDDPDAPPESINYNYKFSTIDRVFAYTQRIAIGGEFRAEYDPALGYPTFTCFHNCYIKEPLVEDGNITIRITNFEQIP